MPEWGQQMYGDAPQAGISMPGSIGGRNPGPIDYSSILDQFGGGAVPGGSRVSTGRQQVGASTPTAGAGSMTNTSSANPGITYANDQLKGLYEGGGNVDALSRQAAGSIRDDAENLRKGARDSATARGVSGGGVESLANSSIDRAVLSDQTKARVGIANDWEARKQGVLRDYAGNAATDENLQNAQRNTALNQQQLQYQQQQGQQSHELDMLSKVFDLFGSKTFA